MSLLDPPPLTRPVADRRYSQSMDIARLAKLDRVSSAARFILPPVLDLNYELHMALYGVETYARAGTESYTDMAGASQTAAINTPAFDRQAIQGLGWVMPFGLKTGNSGGLSFNAAGILPTADYTLVLDIERPQSLTGNGTFFSLHGGSATNRIDLRCNGSYQAQAIVQTGGSVVYNVALGNVQNWYGGFRRLVLAVKSNNFIFSDGQSVNGPGGSGNRPTASNLTNLNVGYSSHDSSYGTGWVKRAQILPFALTTRGDCLNLAAGSAPVAWWGDSLTEGTGASGPSGVVTERTRITRYPYSVVSNQGVGGETSTQIKTRMLADTVRNAWATVIWAGRNNYSALSTVVADIQAMVAHLTHNRFVVLSVINAANGGTSGYEWPGGTGYNQIIALNAALQAAFPNNYLDIRSLIVAASGGSNDAPNVTWTSDGLHGNNTMYAYVGGDQVQTFLGGKLWF